jgi:DNA mismatch repair protein MutS2
MRVKLDELKRKEEDAPGSEDQPPMKKRPAEPASSREEHHSPLMPASPGIELDLRGQRAEDALEMLDRYLEKAAMAGLPFVRIIHGKGTGKLRQEVRTMLKDHPHVVSFEEGGDKEGGAGVTVAKLESG